MTTSDDFKAIVGRLRGWGFSIREESGCYGRSNGTSWSSGKPDAHINHHYVCKLDPTQSYIDGLVANLKNGNTVQWFADVNGRGYLIGTGPMNQAGTGNSSVLALLKADQIVPSPASSAGDMSGNQNTSATECQHPGDSTPWPSPMVDLMVAINAAEFLQWGYSANRAINHADWTNRKIDMSAGGGPSAAQSAELRRRVAERMSGAGPTPPPDNTGDDDMPLNDEDMKRISAAIKGELNQYFANGEGNPNTGRIVQATTKALTNVNIPDQVWNEVMPRHSSVKDGKEVAVDTSARNTLAATATDAARTYLS